MATIQKKIIKGNTYWYLIESRRVKGKPRPMVLAYLGSTAKLIARLGFTPGAKHNPSSAGKPKCFAYGAVAALLRAAQDIGLEEILTRHLPIQQRGGLSVARTLLVASIYRALRPGSKRAFAAWAKDTALPALLSFNPRQLTAQRFWDQMNVVDGDALLAVEAEVAQRVIGQLKVPLDLLLYDATNFYTWISHHNRRNALCQYGRNKQKRNDLRQFNLALLCSRDELVPVLSKVYAGQIPDAKSFPLVIREMRARLAALNGDRAKPITVVMDKGNYSQEIQQALVAAELDWVAAMNPMMIPGTERVRKGYFRPVIVDAQPILAWHRAKRLWGQEGQLIIYYSEKAQHSGRY
jgi:transposase